jgi:hypothetical protein
LKDCHGDGRTGTCSGLHGPPKRRSEAKLRLSRRDDVEPMSSIVNFLPSGYVHAYPLNAHDRLHPVEGFQR